MADPWMKFYPSDWRSDPALRLCSRAARGTWIDMLTIMHEAEPYGDLRVGNTPLDAFGLAKLLGESPEDIARDLDELERHGVFSRRKNGVIYSRRMEKDENLRRKNRENGKKGGLANIRKQREKEDSLKRKTNPQKPEARDQIDSCVVLARAREPEDRKLIDEALEAGGLSDTDLHMRPGLMNIAQLVHLIRPATGPPCDWVQDVIPAIRTATAQLAAKNEPLRSWSYVSTIALSNRNRRLAGNPEVPASAGAAPGPGPDRAVAARGRKPSVLVASADWLADRVADGRGELGDRAPHSGDYPDQRFPFVAAGIGDCRALAGPGEPAGHHGMAAGDGASDGAAQWRGSRDEGEADLVCAGIASVPG